MSSLPLFPAIIPFKINKVLAKSINDRLVKKGYKEVKEAQVYSIDGAKEVVNLDTRYNSWKCEFDDEKLRDILTNEILPTISNKLSSKYKNKLFYLNLGNQKLDYVLYRNGGFFTVHHDFVALQSEGMCQYTCLLGLTDDPKCFGGETTIYTESKNLNDLAKIIESKPSCKLFHTSGEPIGIPHQYNCYQQGNCLLFKSELFHAGEPFCGFKKELLMFTVNIVGISIGDEIDTLNNRLLIRTTDEKSYVIPQSYLSNTVFKGMMAFYDSQILNTDMSSHEFEAMLKFINAGEYTDSDNINNLIQSYVCLDYRFYDCAIPEHYHKKIYDWFNSDEPCIKFDKFEPFMIKFAKEYNLIPFQVILCESSVNKTTDHHKFTTFFNFNESLNTYHNKSILISSENELRNIYQMLRSSNYEYNRIEDKVHEIKQLSFDKGSFDNKMAFEFVDVLNKDHVSHLTQNFSETLNFDDDFMFSRKENIHGKVLEHEWCNDGMYHYYEETTMYFSCKVTIKFCFVKNLNKF